MFAGSKNATTYSTNALIDASYIECGLDFARKHGYNTPAVGNKPRISRRKDDHLRLTATERSNFRNKSTLLEDVILTHQALPELDVDSIDISTTLCGYPLSMPVVISGMTGGTPQAKKINRDLARAANHFGIAFGVGSQRAMAENLKAIDSYDVRDVAPDAFLIGNLGVIQAKEYGVERTVELGKRLQVNAMAIHLNPAMEMIQQNGDRNFEGAVQTLEQLVAAAPFPIIAKETGCGISFACANKLASVGVRTVDVSGAGGTSWVAVEAQRAVQGSIAQHIGQQFWDWGIPTAASVVYCVKAGLEVIATGGLRHGRDVAQALVLGATAGGFAGPILRAHNSHGLSGALSFLEMVQAGIKTTALLAGCGQAKDFPKTSHFLGNNLAAWVHGLPPE